MSLSIIISPIRKISNEHIFTLLKSRDRSLKHILITPDRNTLNLESKLFDALNETSFFDVDVMTFTKLAKSLIGSSNEKILTKHASVSLIKQILINNPDKITGFGRAVNHIGFCNELFQTICMFKSCNISPDAIDYNTKNIFLNNKLKDIKFVYSEYEKKLSNDYTDSFNQLNLFTSLIKKETYKDTILYFVGFDEFTKQMYGAMAKLINSANSVFVATTSSKNVNIHNNNLHLNLIEYDLIDLCKANNFEYKLIEAPLAENINKQLLFNVFSYKKNSDIADDDNSKYSIISFNNIDDEIKHLALNIENLIKKYNCRFKDIAIVLPSMNSSYNQKIIDLFNKLQIPYFLDASDQICNHIICKFILNILSVFSGNFTKYEILNILKSSLCVLNKNDVEIYENIINKYNLNYSLLINSKIDFKENSSAINNCQNFLMNLLCVDQKNKKKFIKDWINDLSVIFESLDFKNKKNDVLNSFLSKNNIIEYKKFQQVDNKLKNVFDEITNVLGGIITDVNGFSEVITTYIQDIMLTMPPISVDSIFIGSATDSYFKDFKYVFIIGANDGSSPNALLDVGLIDDSEIGLLDISSKIAPTVNVINRRNKFKVYENLFIATDKTFIYYPKTSSGEDLFPAIYIENIKRLLNIKEINGSAELDLFPNSHYVLNKENIEFNNVDTYFAKTNLIDGVKQLSKTLGNSELNLLDTLAMSLNKNSEFVNGVITNSNYKFKAQKLENAKNLFFAKSTINISQFEKYFTCPYSHFLAIGLDLRKDYDDISAIENGNIIHEFLKIIVPVVYKNKNQEQFDFDSIIRNSLNNVLKQDKYDYITQNPNNTFYLRSLHNEAIRIVDALIFHFNNSSFIPKHFEFSIGKKEETAVKISIDGLNLKLIGSIDRIDYCDNYFRIIDYKTGKTSSKFNNFDKLISGEKIQLFIYLYAFEKESNRLPAGAFYMPIINSFKKPDETNYRLQGFICNDSANIVNLDNNLKNDDCVSKLVNLKKKSGKLSKSNLLLDNTQIKELCDYAIEMIKLATTDILGGEISPLPLSHDGKLSCDYCDYSGICPYNSLYGFGSKNVEKIKKYDEFYEKILKDKDSE